MIRPRASRPGAERLRLGDALRLRLGDALRLRLGGPARPAIVAALLGGCILVAPPPVHAQAGREADREEHAERTPPAGRGAATEAANDTAANAASQAAAAVADGPSEVEAGDPYRRPPAEALAGRRQALLDSIGEGLVILRSDDEKSIEGDYPQESDFRQDADFWFLTGLETPGSWLVLGRQNGRELVVLFVPRRNPEAEQWTGRKPSFDDATAISGVEDVRPADAFDDFLATADARAFGSAGVYVPLGRDPRADPVLTRMAAEGALPGEARDVRPYLAGLRLVKDEFEVAMLRRAIDVTVAGIRAAMKSAEPGMYEYELEAIIELNFALGGAERVGFPSIIGAGPNSVVLHYDDNRRRMEAGDLVVMDVGAEYSYYSADVTRTIPVSGTFTDRQREIYALVLGAQRAGIEAVRPGATWMDVDRAARVYIRTHSDGLCGARSCDAYFIHGVGHWLGLDVHDVGAYDVPFVPGMVLTVEPGIYLPEEDLGVRIEDDVLVTETGHEVLSAGAPREPERIEALMAKDVVLR